MLTYTTLQDRPREFLAAAGRTLAEFVRVLPAFAASSTALSPPDKTLEGQARQRHGGGGANGVWSPMADKRLFMLVSPTTNPLPTMHGVSCKLRQSQTHSWMHHVLPVLPHAFAALGMAPERDASRVATRPLAREGAPDVASDGTERRRHRPIEPAQHQKHDSGKQKTPTDTNRLLVNAHTDKVVSLGPTVAGKKHDKQAADEAHIGSPTNATLDKDTGLQGYEPTGILTRQPKKPHRPGVERGGQGPQSPHLACPRRRRKRDCWGETVSDGHRCLAPDHRGPC